MNYKYGLSKSAAMKKEAVRAKMMDLMRKAMFGHFPKLDRYVTLPAPRGLRNAYEPYNFYKDMQSRALKSTSGLKDNLKKNYEAYLNSSQDLNSPVANSLQKSINQLSDRTNSDKWSGGFRQAWRHMDPQIKKIFWKRPDIFEE